MTEQEWLNCTDPQALLTCLHQQGRLSERKARLFGVVCCRRIWPLLTDERSRSAVEIAERFADGLANGGELSEALTLAWQAYHDVERSWVRFPQKYPGADLFAAEAVGWLTADEDQRVSQVERDSLSRMDGVLPVIIETARHARLAIYHKEKIPDEAEKAAQAHLLRILEPFRPASVDPVWLRWHAGTISKLAQAIYDERAFERMPILADALEEAGCTDADILAHCRGTGPHVRGCWVLDLLLGRK